ncbi:MAG: alanine racemase [Clostridiaceae bacterium]|nr:alanine racemase [Clostridiaceae bacterium]
MTYKKRDTSKDKTRVWAEISRSALLNNVAVIRSHLAPETRMAAVVKADAYGHRAGLVAPILENEAGVNFFAVATLEEAIELRELGIRGDILILASVDPRYVGELKHYDLIVTVMDQLYVGPYAQMAAKSEGALRLHLKLDTGMARLGLSTRKEELEQSLAVARAIEERPELQLEGVFSHLASGAADPDFSKRQLDLYHSFLSAFQLKNGKKLVCHLAASSALTNQDFALDMVRPGIALYGGQTPPPELWQNLRPVMSFFSRVFLLREVTRGTSVSYSQTWHAERDTRLALIEAGYADGIMRILSNRGSWLINGVEAPIVGRVCMDCCLVDVTDLPQVQVGDRALFFGEYNGKRLSAAEQAEKAETIDYELFTGIRCRVPRILV